MDQEREPRGELRALPLRERKRLKTGRRLAEVALELFAERGYDQTSIGEIAEAADVSPRTFFRYYPSKEELLFTYPNREHPLFFITDDRFRMALQLVLEQDPALGDLAALGIALRSLAPDIAAYRRQIGLLQQACASSAALRGRRSDANEELERRIADVLSERHGRPEPACRTGAAVGMALYRLAVTRWLDGPEATPLEAHLAAVFAELAALG